MVTALYPGTFDPVHNGHVNIAKRAARLFDELIIAIYDRPLKNLLFTADERRSMLEKTVGPVANMSVVTYNQLTVDFARSSGASVIVRGLRVISDFELEFQMALTNRKLAPEIESVCLMTSLEYAFISASTVKEIAMLGGCVEGMVPPHVAAAMQAKFEREDEQAGERVRLVSLRD
ncbi:pantetheine-phosphate adenylyltransferase [Chloroflexota bacterium]